MAANPFPKVTIRREIGDIALELVFEIEPYIAGVRYFPDGSGEPPSGGYATLIEVSLLDGSKVADESWPALGLHDATVERLEGEVYQAFEDEVEKLEEGR
jgi:hypothetical protein